MWLNITVLHKTRQALNLDDVANIKERTSVSHLGPCGSVRLVYTWITSISCLEVHNSVPACYNMLRDQLTEMTHYT